MHSRLIYTAGATSLLFWLQACSGGGGSSSSSEVSGLEAPGQVSLVNASEEEVVASGGIAPGSNLYPAGSDYNTDVARTWVYDPSMQALDQVNAILCYMNMTAYDEMVNLGPYIAQINTSLCETGESSDSAGSDSGQSSGSGGEAFEFFTVRSTRSDNKSPQTARIWVPQDEEDRQGTIYVKLRIDEGASDTNPTGDFSLSFASASSFDTIEEPYNSGALASLDTANALGYQFFEKGGDINATHGIGEYSRETALTVSMDEDQENGAARVRVRERTNWGDGDSGIQTEEWLVAFNPTHFKRQSGDDDPITLSRDEFNTTVWRYKLYHAEGDDLGDEVELNSGFSFVTEDGNFGWAGYYGIWAPDHVTLEDGDTITQQHFGDQSAGEAYTVVMAPGRLIKSERQQLDLTDLGGQSLQYWDWSDGMQYLAEYDTGAFFKVAQFDNQTHEWIDLESPEEIDAGEHGGFLGFWSDSLGGPVNWVDGDDFVIFFEESFVTGASELFDDFTDGQAQLYSYFSSLGAELTGSEVETGAIFLEDSFDVEVPYSYIFDADDLTLYYDENGDGSSLLQVGLADGEEPENGPYSWGMRSGPMVTDTSQLENVNDIWDLDVYYSYETGHNQWNKFSALKDTTDNYVEFDAPIQFLYTHSTEADRNDSDVYDGNSYFFEYNGAGNMHGIPWVQGEFEGAGDFERWFPAFNIADGTVMGPDGTEYVIRAMEMEQTLAEDEAGAEALSLAGATALTLPDSTLFTTPDIGESPDVDAPPAVINGVVQTSSASVGAQ